MTARRPLERDVQRDVLTYLRTVRRIPVVRVNSGAAVFGQGRSRRFVRFADHVGIADVIGLVPPTGRFLSVEVKRPGGHATPAQLAWQDLVRESGGVALVVTGVEDLIAQLAAHGLPP